MPIGGPSPLEGIPAYWAVWSSRLLEFKAVSPIFAGLQLWAVCVCQEWPEDLNDFPGAEEDPACYILVMCSWFFPVYSIVKHTMIYYGSDSDSDYVCLCVYIYMILHIFMSGMVGSTPPPLEHTYSVPCCRKICKRMFQAWIRRPKKRLERPGSFHLRAWDLQ